MAAAGSLVATVSGEGPPTVPAALGEVGSGVSIGRFTVLECLGTGAMGVVYAAYDPQLDRRVALKILRARDHQHSARGNARLMREAQAMARLSHPNVVVVHDVGTHGRDVFLAMEFIHGVTLQTWLKQRARGWREVVAVLRQAGAGLAAAHAAGIVHRDFKPANVILGDDGRVRVLDFGLCASAGPRSESSGVYEPLPPQRVIVGTPAYMSPEQFRGEIVDTASDQFSFCITLFEALFGVRPFVGETAQSLALSVLRSEIREPPPGIAAPSWLLATIARGLKTDPQDRFASMDELLRALDRSRARGRQMVGVAGLVAVLAGVGGYLAATSSGAADDACNGGAREIAAIWGPQARAELGEHFATLGPDHAAELFPPIAGTLDAYAAEWGSAHEEACHAHRRGEHSEVVLDQRMVCLAQRKAGLREAVAVLGAADGEVAARGLEIARGLPALQACGDLQELARQGPLPDDPAARAALAEQRAQLERVHTLERAGRVRPAIELADTVIAAAERSGHAPVVAEALLARSRLSIHMNGEWQQDDALITRAYLTAFGAHADDTALEALALRIYRRGREAGKADRALDDIGVARAYVDRLTASERLRGLVLNSAGSTLLALGDLPAAEQALREALKAQIAAFGARHLAVGYTLSNLAKVAATDREREARVLQALEIFEAELGPAHPHTAEIRIAAGASLPDPRLAAEILARGCAALDRFAGEQTAQRVRCLAHLAHQSDESGQPTVARDTWLRAAVLLHLLPPGDTALAIAEIALVRGYAALYTDHRADAIAGLKAALPSDAPAVEWWRRSEQAELRLCLGLNLAAEGRTREARDELTAAVDGFAAIVGADPARDIMAPRYLSRARIELAALLAEGDSDDQRRAAAELEEAARWYRSAGPAFAWRVDAITAQRASMNVK